MKKILIRGGNTLHGDIYVSGMKNAALPIIFASILTADKCVLENLPDVRDVNLALEILKKMGAEIERIDVTTVSIDTKDISLGSNCADLVSKMRASTYLLGAELGRFGEAKVGFTGGCDFGVRPIDQHKKGFEALGATVTIEDGCHYAKALRGLRGASVYLDIASVGATINVMLAACLAPGRTTIDNAAREPHIVDVANFLNMCGARITGAGTSFIKIQGVDALHGCSYTIIPDMIEAGTYMVAAAATGGRVNVRGVIPKHMETVTAKLAEMGCGVDESDECITVSRSTRLTAADVKTYFYPGFPTDMHPQLTAVLCGVKGTSYINESIYENRFRYVEELKRMGAQIKVDGRIVVIEGGAPLTAAPVVATDLRGGAAVMILALMAEGKTEISEIRLVERGYDNIVEKLRSLGADIKKVVVPDTFDEKEAL